MVERYPNRVTRRVLCQYEQRSTLLIEADVPEGGMASW
jgi:hypothetical protein